MGEMSEKKGRMKTNCIEEKGEHKPSTCLPNGENGNKNGMVKGETAETASVISTSESEETDANKPESCYQTYDVERIKDRSNETSLAREIVSSAKKAEFIPAFPPQL